jgi:Uma2 family endonuclease
MAGVKAVRSRVSYPELERWPDDGRRYELYDGEVSLVPSPIVLHQIVAGHLYTALNDYVREHGGIVLFAPLDVVLTDYDVVQPDLLLFVPERQHLLDPQTVARVPPDLAIEILSPGTAGNDRGRKKQVLERHGVKEYWLVDPKAVRVEIYSSIGGRFAPPRIASDEERVCSPLLPELTLAPADLVPA